MILAISTKPAPSDYAPRSVTHAIPNLRESSLGGFSVASEILIEEIRVGPTVYPLGAPTRGYFLPPRATCGGKFWVDGFSPKFAGEGETVLTARTDWEENVHSEFQRLYAMRDFEMSDADRETWGLLAERIDVELYREMTPLIGREIGKVMAATPGRRRIQWLDGMSDDFTLSQVPGAFAAYKAGSWFEAQVVRNPLNGRFMEILSAQRITSLDAITPAEVRELEQQFPTSKDLPAATL
jgi:hypothetical protein